MRLAKSNPRDERPKTMLRIYVSSTTKDLRREREGVARALRLLGHFPEAMDDHPASSDRPLARCLDDINQCDAFVGIYAWRYGDRPSPSGPSFTELEYSAAQCLPCYIFLLAEDAEWPVEWHDDDLGPILALRERLCKERIVSFFRTPDELAMLVTAAIARVPPENKSPHPPRPTIPPALPYLADRSEQVRYLTKAIEQHRAQGGRRPIVVVAHGDEREALDALTERLWEEILPRALEIDSRSDSVCRYRVKWSIPALSLQQRIVRLSENFAYAVKGRREVEQAELAATLARSGPAIMISTSLSSDEWQTHEPKLISTWMQFWGQWPDLPSNQTIVIVLAVSYRCPRGLHIWEKWATQNTNIRIRRYLSSLKDGVFDHITMLTLPELTAVRENDVLDWLHDEVERYCQIHEGIAPGIVAGILTPRIKELFRQQSPRIHSGGIQMDPLGRELQRLLSDAFVEIGGSHVLPVVHW